jgi:phospholipid transport system substrate-binding protein
MTVIVSRRGLVKLLAGVGVSVGISVGLGMAVSGMARAADPGDVAAPIATLNAGLIEAMKAGHDKPFRDRYRALAPVIESAFDLPQILQVSIGPRWASLPPAIQAQLLHVFRRFTIASYVANFDTYDGERFELLPDTRSIGADQVVATRMVAGNGETIRLDYVMRAEDGGWKAIDVLMDGSISRVAVQRSDFRGVLGQGGASDLIASLQRKVADLSGGSLDS